MQIPIPASATMNRMQFCIRFKSDAGEFWDNNQGKNYVLVKADPLKNKSSSAAGAGSDLTSNNNYQRNNNLNNNTSSSTAAKLNTRMTFDKFTTDIISPKGIFSRIDLSSHAWTPLKAVNPIIARFDAIISIIISHW